MKFFIQSESQFNSTPAHAVAVFNLLRLHTCSRRADGVSQSVSVPCANTRFTVWNRLLQPEGRGRGFEDGAPPQRPAAIFTKQKAVRYLVIQPPSGFIFGHREQTHQPAGQFLSLQNAAFYVTARALVSIRVRDEERSRAVKTSCL